MQVHMDKHCQLRGWVISPNVWSYYIHFVVCLMTAPWPLPRWDLHRMRSSASSFSFQHPHISLRSSSSCLHLHFSLHVTFVLPFFPSVTCSRRQFLRKMWPIQLAFLPFIVRRIFLSSLFICNTSSYLTWSVKLIFSILLKHYISKLPRYFWSSVWSAQVSAPYKAVLQI